MLLPRVLTALVGIPALLYFMHLGGLAYWALITVIAGLALHEYAAVLWLGGRGVQRWLSVLGGAALAGAVGLDGTRMPGLPALVLTALTAAAVLREVFRKEHSLDRAALTVFGALFVGWGLGHLPLVRGLEKGELWTYLIFAAVWTCDSAAYFVGRGLGKHKLAEVISPKKTWEGAAGGLAGAFAAVFIARGLFLREVLSLPLAVGTALLVGTLGQVSDLAQSLVKRAAGAKDSSSLLPGHGGLFDRMDSFLLLAPAYYYLLVFFGSR
ncbi:MAG: phosphatidate cytidylyltransferase [Elusimicrobia bacterium]|nr:phosphatidate cytidylyltransferase [Elusimicrobiota bacterium]